MFDLTPVEGAGIILLVEDNPSDTRLLQIFIEESNIYEYTLLIRTTLKESIETIHEYGLDAFQAVMLDLNLPDSRGFDTLEAMLGEFPKANVIVLTGYDDTEMGLRAIKAGAQDFLSKGSLDAVDLAKALRYSIERSKVIKNLEEAQQLAHIGNFEYQVDTQTFSFSDEGQKILEVSHPDVPLDKLKQIILPSDRSLLDEWFNIVREKEFAKGDLRLLFDDNRLKFVFVQYKMVRQRNGKPFKVTGILQDITDRKLAEQEILENQERYQSIFTQSKDAIMFSNWLGDIIDCNDATLHLFGYTRDEIQEVKLVQLYKKPEERERLVSLLEEHGSVYDYEVEMLTKTGQIRNCLISVTKTQTLTFAGYQGIIRDITEKRQNETLIKAKELAERTAELKQQFLAKVSHEIRTPMNAILGMTHLMLKSDLDAEQVNTAQTIKQASENLLSIINDILEISQLQSGAIHFEDKAFSLKQVLKGIISMFEYKIKEKGLKFVFDYDIEDDLALIGDPIRLGQILINLINNSIKFTDKGFVALNVKILESLEDAFSLQFEIEDSGEGISPEKLEHVFDMFVQVSDDFNKVYGGTGLGLAIVKQLVDLQNGKIGLKSTKGVGTCFSIALTFKKNADPHAIEDVELEDQPMPLRPLQILLAEDNRMNQVVARKIIESEWPGTHIIVAETGVQALDLLRANQPDLVLMDLQMPEMEGTEATLIIRQEFEAPKKDIPILAMTAHALITQGDKYKSYGFNDYVLKPFEPKQLFLKIREYLPQLFDINIPQVKANTSAKAQSIQTQKIIDLSYLEMMSDNDPEMKQTLIEMILADVPKELDLLEKAIQEHRWDDVRKISHKLKSTTPFVGNAELDEYNKSIERNCINNYNLDAIPSIFTKTKDMFSRAFTELEAVLKNQG